MSLKYIMSKKCSRWCRRVRCCTVFDSFIILILYSTLKVNYLCGVIVSMFAVSVVSVM